MKTIAQQLNIKEFPFSIKDKKGNELYYETSNGYWCKYGYDSNGNQIYYENSNGNWYKKEFDSNGNQIYYENYRGEIINNRNIPEYTMEELVEKLGFDFKIKK